MFISVIIPAYNSARTIGEALDSILNQTLWRLRDGQQDHGQQTTCEIIIVDDASTDGTVGTVREWAARNGLRKTEDGGQKTEDRFQGSGFSCKLIQLAKNSGPAAARNCGIAEAKGEWIAFLDADDVWLPDKLEVQLAFAQEKPDVALWCGGVVECEAEDGKRDTGNGENGEGEKNGKEIFNTQHSISNTQVLKDSIDSQQSSTEVSDTSSAFAGAAADKQVSSFRSQVSGGPLAFTPLPLSSFAVGNPVATSTVLVKKSAILEVGGFDEQFRGPEDYDLWMRIAATRSMMKINATLAKYRSQSGSLSMDYRKFLRQVMAVLDKAFGEGGAFRDHRELRPAAVSNQYWNASWMAFSGGERSVAIAFLLRAYFSNPQSGRKTGRKWFRLLMRYLVGRSVRPSEQVD